MSKQTRRRELQRLRARREAERQRARRRRALFTYGGLGLVVVVAAVAGGLWLTGDDDTPAAATATTAARALGAERPTWRIASRERTLGVLRSDRYEQLAASEEVAWATTVHLVLIPKTSIG
jgi:hypothetical protein